MLNLEGFWLNVILFVVGLGVIYTLLHLFLFKRLKNSSKSANTAINALLAIGITYLLFRIYKAFPEGLETRLFLTIVLNSIVQVCVLALATTGIVLIFKTSTTANFAQGMMATAGAFVAAKIIAYLASTYSDMNATWIVIVAMIIGALTSFVVGLSIDVAIIRQAKYPTPVGKQMITMGLVLVFTGLIPIIFGTLELRVNKLSYAPNMKFDIGAVTYSITVHAFYAILITVGLLVILFSLLRFTKWGLGVRATASNELVASMMGVNTRVITALSWAIAGLLAGVAAVLWAPNSGALQVSFMLGTQVNGFLAAILGSFSSFAGPLVASLLIPILNNLMSVIATTWGNAIVYVIILVIVLVKPSGLFGKQIAKKV